jgi:hypothetical protein
VATFTSTEIAATYDEHSWERSPWKPSDGQFSISIPPEKPQTVTNVYQAPSVSSS